MLHHFPVHGSRSSPGMRRATLLKQTLRPALRHINTTTTRLAVAFLLISLVVSLVHRVVPFPFPGSGGQNVPAYHAVANAGTSIPQGRALAQSRFIGNARGGVYVPLRPVPPGPQPSPTPNPQPTPGPVSGQSTQQNPSPTPDNPLGWFFKFITGQATPDSTTVAQSLLAILEAICNQIFGSAGTDLLLAFTTQSSFLWTTPPEMTYMNAGLQTVWSAMLTVAAGLFLLIFMWNGIQLLWRRSSLDYAAALETLPRAIFAFFLAVFSKNFLQLLIDLNNGLCSGLQKPDVFQMLNTSNADFLFALVLLVYGFMGLLLLITSALRMGLLAIELAVGPLACMCLGAKETEPIGRLWLHVTVATIFMQFLQALALLLGMKYLTPIITGALPNQNVVSALIGIAILYLTLQIPKWLQHAALASLHDAGHSVTAVIGGTVRTTVMAARVIAA